MTIAGVMVDVSVLEGAIDDYVFDFYIKNGVHKTLYTSYAIPATSLLDSLRVTPIFSRNAPIFTESEFLTSFTYDQGKIYSQDSGTPSISGQTIPTFVKIFG